MMETPTGESLREYLDLLASNELLITVEKDVDRSSQVPSILFKLSGKGYAVLFKRVKGSSFPLVGNLVTSRRMLGLALGCDPTRVPQVWYQRCKHLVPPVLVDRGPVQEVIRTGTEARLTDLPVVTHAEKDAGPYITAGVVVAKDPDTGIRNLSINRMLLLDEHAAAIRSMPPQQLGVLHAKAEARFEPLPVAVVIGMHPVELMAAATSLPPGQDELEVAGALRGKPVRLVKCRTVELEVPASAEIVIEGEILPGERVPEAPFGDFMQFYMPEVQSPVLRVTAITHRNDAMYHTIHAGTNDDMHILAPSREAKVLGAVRQAGIEVVAVSLLPTILGCAISIIKGHEGEGINAALAALGTYRWLKSCIVVDQDVNVYDYGELLWAIATRCRPETGILVIPQAAGFPRDPRGIHQSKVVIDATVPVGTWEEFERRRPPGMDTVRLQDFLPPEWGHLIES
jgi:UbiD family decarboxylase